MKVSDSSCSLKVFLSIAYILLSILDSFMHAGLLKGIVLIKRFSFKRIRLYLYHI